MFWDPKVISKFAKCGISVLDAPREVVGTVLIYLGKDANTESPEDLQGRREGADVDPSLHPQHQFLRDTSRTSPMARSASRWAGPVTSLQARDRADEAGKGMEIKYNIPKEGAVMFFDNCAIPADALAREERAPVHQLHAARRTSRPRTAIS